MEKRNRKEKRGEKGAGEVGRDLVWKVRVRFCYYCLFIELYELFNFYFSLFIFELEIIFLFYRFVIRRIKRDYVCDCILFISRRSEKCY